MAGKCRVLMMGPDPPPVSVPGAEIVWVPVVRLDLIKGSSLRVLAKLEESDSIAFTSPRGPRMLREDSEASLVYGRLKSLMRSRRKAVVGPQTGRALEESFGLSWDIMPRKYRGEELAEELVKSGSKKVVIARSKMGERAITEVLKRSGVVFHDIPVYEATIDWRGVRKAATLIDNRVIDVIAFTSSTIARTVCRTLGGSVPGSSLVIAIGPTTSRAVRMECGVEPVVPENFNYDYLVKKAVSLCRNA
ncbi:MAG: uroporphyrinogen-III synthase [Desulfurococcales archaeon]|nr:uroporphyrinogen-III synthase [Desulfurococcales archaeon]